MHKNFCVDDRVIFIAGEFAGTGTILGCASKHITDCYIILLDKPLPEYKAAVLPEGCIELYNG